MSSTPSVTDDAGNDNSSNAPVEVRLLDKAYLVACAEHERAGLIEAARLLDERLRSMKQLSKGATLERIAVLAALDLAHERLLAERALAEQESQAGRLLQDIERQLARLPRA